MVYLKNNGGNQDVMMGAVVNGKATKMEDKQHDGSQNNDAKEEFYTHLTSNTREIKRPYNLFRFHFHDSFFTFDSILISY